MFQFLFFNIPLTIYLSWKADKIVAGRKKVSENDYEAPKRRSFLCYITSNKVFSFLIVFQIVQVTFSMFLSNGLMAGFLSPVRTWCIPFAIFLRYRLKALGEKGL